MNRPTALITGSTGGIGVELAKRLDENGYRLILVDLNEASLAAQARAYAGASYYVLDLRDEAAVSRFCSATLSECPTPHVAIVNAGMIAPGDLVSLPAESLRDQLVVNLVSTAVLIQALAKRMCEVRRGHILATVSIGGIVALRGSAPYSASKFGLRGLLWAARDELFAHGVHVTGIYPAAVDTPMLRYEARTGGSPLNFLETPVSTRRVVDAFMFALRRPRLEVYVPYSDSLSARIAAAFPWLLRRFYPLLERLGERGRAAYLERIATPAGRSSADDSVRPPTYSIGEGRDGGAK